MTHTVIVVDDQPEFLEYAQGVLGRSPDFNVVGVASSGPEALALLPLLKAEVAVVDVIMPDMNGFELVRRLLELDPALRVVMLSLSTNLQNEVTARQVGAVGFIPKKEFSAKAVSRILD